MQIFILDKNIKQNAKYYTDKHIIKIPLEIAQMISTAYHTLNTENLPEFIFKKSSYINHPCNIWVRESLSNFKYACKLGLALYNEYQYRYNKPYKMQRVKKIFEYGLKYPPKIKDSNLTPFAQAIKEDCKHKDTVKAYRKYYLKYKTHLFSWKKRKKPNWIKI